LAALAQTHRAAHSSAAFAAETLTPPAASAAGSVIAAAASAAPAPAAAALEAYPVVLHPVPGKRSLAVDFSQEQDPLARLLLEAAVVVVAVVVLQSAAAAAAFPAAAACKLQATLCPSLAAATTQGHKKTAG
jgi:hypothetical protein